MHLHKKPLSAVSLEYRGQAMRNIQRPSADRDTDEDVTRSPRHGAGRRDALRRQDPGQCIALAEVALDLLSYRGTPRAGLVDAGSLQEHVAVVCEHRHRGFDVTARSRLLQSREHARYFRFNARIGFTSAKRHGLTVEGKGAVETSFAF